MAFTSDSPRFTLPPGRVQSLNPTAWRTNSTLCAASSIQAMTDTSLVGRVLAIFGRGLGIQLYGHLELLARAQLPLQPNIAAGQMTPTLPGLAPVAHGSVV